MVFTRLSYFKFPYIPFFISKQNFLIIEFPLSTSFRVCYFKGIRHDPNYIIAPKNMKLLINYNRQVIYFMPVENRFAKKCP